MLKQNFCLKKSCFNRIFFVFSSSFVMLFAFLVVLPSVSESTHAEGDEPDEGISVIASSDISINLLSSDDGYYKIAKDSITVSTSSENGYTLFIATDSPDHQILYLNGDASSESRINGTSGTYESPSVLGDYEWGFAVPGVSHFDDMYSTTNPSIDSKFAILPLENKIIRDYTEPATENTTDIYYGFKLSGTLEPGEYQTAITYTAIPADQPLTAKAVLGDNGNLNFLYDRKTYTVGETYADNIGEATIMNIYNDIPMSGIERNDSWAWVEQSDSIYTANFDKSFANARMTSTVNLLRNLRNLTTVTNPQNLNTSQVVSMLGMFAYAGNDASTFSVDLGSWDTSKTKNMSFMFYSAGYGAGTWEIRGIDRWNTGSVTDVSAMFYKAGYSASVWSIGDIGSWDTSHIETMYYMFAWAGYSANEWSIGDLANWDTSQVTNMMAVFGNSGYSSSTWSVGNIGHWDTSKVTDMSYAFNNTGYSAETINLDLSGWDTSKVTTMKATFYCFGYNAETFELDVNSWKTGNLVEAIALFDKAGYKANIFELDLSVWDTGNITTMHEMFFGAGQNATVWSVGDLSGWDTRNVVDMSSMFRYAGENAVTWDIGNLNYIDESHKGWDVGNVTNHSNFVNWNQANIDTSKLPWQSN